MLRNSKDKRARRLAKKRVRSFPKCWRYIDTALDLRSPPCDAVTNRTQLGTFGRAKRKVEEMTNIIAESRRAGH